MKRGQERTKTEEFVKEINSQFFFREFTYFNTEFRTKEKDEYELADGMVWLDDLLFVFQIKDREEMLETTPEKEHKWFKKKILDQAVGQIKKTEEYLQTFNESFEFENERGHTLDLSELNKSELVRLIVYKPSDQLPEECRFRKFYQLKSSELIHLFHSEDYYWICRYLITPDEINDYLLFRERFYFRAGNIVDKLPEQYFLSHYLSEDRSYEFKARLGTLLEALEEDWKAFDITRLIEVFWGPYANYSNLDENYTILRELAKLGRQELELFRERFDRILELAYKKTPDLPFRFYSPRTGCGFVFWYINIADRNKVIKGVKNLTYAHKYDQKLEKCVGVVAYEPSSNDGYVPLQWCFIESSWKSDPKMDQELEKNNPFRPVKTQKIREYNFKK